MDEPAPTFTLAYATPAETAPEPHRGLLTAATACALFPLCFGAVMLIGLVATGDEFFSALAMLAALLAFILFLLGVCFLLRYFWETTRLPPAMRKPHYRAMTLRFLLLLANFPAAVVGVMIAEWASRG
jgi:hypothetical protein